MKKVDIGIGVFLFVLCCFLFYVTFGFYQPPTQIAAPSLWPRIILVCLALLSLGDQPQDEYRDHRQDQRVII